MDVEPVSDQIHVLGSGIQALFVAHCLSGQSSSYPPVRLILNREDQLRDWTEARGTITLHRDGAFITRNRAVAEIVKTRGNSGDVTPIDNLIVAGSSGTTGDAIARIKHRINRQTTICLIQDGLGVVEFLNQHHFSDPATRPSYVLGHMTHNLWYSNNEFTLAEKERGKLCLTAYDPDSESSCQHDEDLSGVSEPGVRHLLRMLTTTPDLWAGAYSLPKLLQRKIPDMVFKSVMDPIASMLDLPYERILPNRHARFLAYQLLDEISSVILALPESQKTEKLVDWVKSGAIKKSCWQQLEKVVRASVDCVMTADIRVGKSHGMTYMNGWFMKQGRKAGVQCPMNKMVHKMISAKVFAARAAIPLERRRIRFGKGSQKRVPLTVLN